MRIDQTDIIGNWFLENENWTKSEDSNSVLVDQILYGKLMVWQIYLSFLWDKEQVYK